MRAGRAVLTANNTSEPERIIRSANWNTAVVVAAAAALLAWEQQPLRGFQEPET